MNDEAIGRPAEEAGGAAGESVRAEGEAPGRTAADWERAYRSAVVDRELATELAGRPLRPGAAAQLVRLWRDELELVEESGRERVVSRDGRALAKAVEEWLSSPEYGHFREPTSRGGGASRGPSRPGGGGMEPPAPASRTLGEAVLREWRQSQSTSRAGGPGLGLVRRR